MKKAARIFAIVTVLMAGALLLVQQDAHARAGSGGSMGSRGSRSYSQPMAPPSQMPSRQYAPSQPYGAPYQTPYQRPGLGSFGRGMLGGLAGGMLGGMLSRSMGFGGGYGGGYGGGIGLFDILLLGGIAWFIWRMVKKNREREGYDQGGYGQSGKVININQYESQPQEYLPPRDELQDGLGFIRQMDPSFDERRFNDQVMDVFFKVQGAWMNRDLAPVAGLLTDEMRGIMQQDIDRLLREHRVNRLENIAVRTVEISEAWQESGRDYLTAMIYANLLDYTTDDASGAVVNGSKTDPVKFEEFWTFTRPVGSNPWKLTAINQR